MKLAVRAKALGKKLTLMTTAFVLAVSSLTALTPFVLAESANAIGGSPNMVTASNVTTDSMTLNFNIAQSVLSPDFEIEAGAASGSFDIQVDDGFIGNYTFPVGSTPAPFSGVNSYVQVREEYIADDFSFVKGEWQKFYVAAPAPDTTAPVITINGSTNAKRAYPAGTVRIQVADNNYDKTVIQQKNSSGVYIDRFTYVASKGKSFKIDWLGDGEYRVQAFDAANNASKALVFAIDTTAPQTTFNTPIANQVVGHKFTLSGKATDNIGLNRVYVQLVNREDNKRYAGQTVHLSGTEQDWTYNIDANSLNLPEGTYAAHVSVVDNAGNSSSVGWTANFRLEKTVPVFEITNLQNSDVISTKASGKITINGTLTDPSGAYAFLQLVKDGVSRGGFTTYAQITDGVLGEFDATGLEDGQYDLFYTPTDYLGNAIDRSVIHFTLDNKNPTVSVSLSSDFIYSNNVQPNVTIDANDENGIDYVQYKVVRAENQSDTVMGWVTIDNQTPTSLDISGLSDGSYVIVARAFDKAGNKKSGAEATFTVNRTIETSLFVSSLESATPTLSGVLKYANGTPVAETSVIVNIDGIPYSPITTSAEGVWSVSPTVGAGPHAVTVSLANGISSPSKSFTTTFAPVDEEEEEETANPAGANPLQTPAAATPLIVSPAGQAALGANDDADDNGTPAVEGTSTEKNLAAAVNNTDGSAFGLAWYWWLLIVAGLATILWWIIAAARRRQEEN